MNDADLQKEALRQRMLLRALWRDARPAVVAGWLRDGPRFERGLAAYRANAGALAERALAAAFPTVAPLLGDEAFAALARAFWHAAPPARGDMALWGEALPGFIAADAQLAEEPYLADVARLDWAVHRAEHAADASPPTGLQRLADGDLARLRLQLQPGAALVVSPHPVVAIWRAHRDTHAERFAPVRAAFAAGRGETALVLRHGWRVDVLSLEPAPARFCAALLRNAALAEALATAGDGFDFETWLVDALQRGAVAAVTEDLA
jgi:Putative DNA-binding domain